MQKQIILASSSPRRKELLEQIGLKFIIHPSEFEEKLQLDDKEKTPKELAIYNALGKAQKIARHYKNALIIGVDTIVAFQNHIIGKPKDREDAARILRLLSNTTHQVITGISIFDSDRNRALNGVEITDVTMDRLEEKDIMRYIASGEGEDKAAGYAIQGMGSLFVKKIDGDYFNVVGLPIHHLYKLLYKQWSGYKFYEKNFNNLINPVLSRNCFPIPEIDEKALATPK
ncbi:septum formation protein Maf [Candidatus Peregrinibacteria bacterium]|nr:septum formation protein Maf [Candidatus Peregrinibacteria bacterium]